MPATQEAASAARDRYLAALSQYPGMERVDIQECSEGYALKVTFSSGIPSNLPADLDGVPVIGEPRPSPGH